MKNYIKYIILGLVTLTNLGLAGEPTLVEAMKGKNGVTKVADWWNPDTSTQEGSYWKLNQVRGNFAMFVYLNDTGTKDFVIAVKKTSIKKAAGPGSSLAGLVDCLSYGGSTKAKNAQGFDITVRVYEAVSCPN